MRGNILEFALGTMMITLVSAAGAIWIATVIGNEIEELFSIIITALEGV